MTIWDVDDDRQNEQAVREKPSYYTHGRKYIDIILKVFFCLLLKKMLQLFLSQKEENLENSKTTKSIFYCFFFVESCTGSWCEKWEWK